MKKSYKLASVALLGALGVGLAVASESKAVSNTAEGDGKIRFTNDIPSLTDGTNIYPPDTTEPIIAPTTGVIPGSDELQFEFVSPLDFDTHKVVTHENEKTFNVITYTAPEANSNGEFTMPHFVRFRDLRNDEDATNDYNVSAQLTKGFQTANGALLKADLLFNKVTLGSSENGLTRPTPEVIGSGTSLEPSFRLTDPAGVGGGASVTVLTQKQDDKGYGRHEIMFGSYDDVQTAGAGNEYTGVQLIVPGDVSLKTNVDYKATITWTIEDTP